MPKLRLKAVGTAAMPINRAQFSHRQWRVQGASFPTLMVRELVLRYPSPVIQVFQQIRRKWMSDIKFEDFFQQFVRERYLP